MKHQHAWTSSPNAEAASKRTGMILHWFRIGQRWLRQGSPSRRIGLAAMLGLATAALPIPASAQGSNAVVITGSGQIAKLLSDWNSNAMLVRLSANVAFTNPGGCAATDYYETDPSDSAAALNHSMLLSAYMAHANLALVVQGCSFSGRPHIISVSMPS